MQTFLRNRNIQEQPTNQDKPKMLLLAGTCILNVSNIEICYILKILIFFRHGEVLLIKLWKIVMTVTYIYRFSDPI